ncbi:MAG TPA: DnaD domain protein [Desulfotomaculum sp.]|nr:DnaD domain protein [Desulfotomaculum sp.]
MAWIESHQTLGQHPKTRRLARYLGISLPAAVGHLHYLWWWALNYAQNGDLSRYELEDIADAALWDGDAKSFVEALVKSGFLDLADEGLCIHDWDDYAGRLIDKRKANSERARKWREKKNNEHETNAFVMHNERATNDATVPNLTLPNQTSPNKDTKDDDKIQSTYMAQEQPPEPEPSSSLSSSDSLDPELGKLARLYEEEGFGAITETVREELVNLYDEFGAAWVSEAIREAVLQNKRRLKYVAGILENWRREGGVRRSDVSAGGATGGTYPKARGDPAGKTPKSAAEWLKQQAAARGAL